MAEDLSSNLQSYQMQLQQVEAALTNEPNNEELLKLKKDLQEVILLTTELIAANTEKATPSASNEGSSKESSQKSKWRTGDMVMAPWSEDGLYYEAMVGDITEDGQCTVNFTAYDNTEVTNLEHLRPLDKELGEYSESTSKSRKQIIQAQKEYKKKKAQKKAQRMKQLEEEREKEKLKWHSFNAKAFNKKGCVKKSIFASPDNINGRVGIGTCGIGGRPMTEFQQQEKWRRPMNGPLSSIKAAAALRGQSSH